MERRGVQRFTFDLPLEVVQVPSTDGRSAVKYAQIRDISSAGASFYSSADWGQGQEVLLRVLFDEKLLGKYAYTAHFSGRIVRRGTEKPGSRDYFAISFTDQGPRRGARSTGAGGSAEVKRE